MSKFAGKAYHPINGSTENVCGKASHGHVFSSVSYGLFTRVCGVGQ